MSQGRWPDRREEPRGGLVFAEAADFQALACGGAAAACSWRLWPSFPAEMVWGCSVSTSLHASFLKRKEGIAIIYTLALF